MGQLAAPRAGQVVPTPGVGQALDAAVGGAQSLVDASSSASQAAGRLEGKRDHDVFRPDGSTITDIDEIAGGVLWEHKEGLFPYEPENWIQKHIMGKASKILEARQHMADYENAPIGFRIGAANDPEFKGMVEHAIENLRTANPEVDFRLEWVD